MIKVRLSFETIHENPKFSVNVYIQPSPKPGCIEMWVGSKDEVFTVKYQDLIESLEIIHDFVIRE